MTTRARTLLVLLAGIVPLAAAPVAHGQVPPPPSLTLDTFFAPPSGIADGDFSPTNIIPDVPSAVAVHGDRIYTVGRTGSSSSQDIGIIARRTDGTFDTGFSDDGKLVIPIAPSPATPPIPAGNEEDDGRGIAVLPDGRIRVVGTTDTNPAPGTVNRDVVVLGLNPDGTPDMSFGTPDVRGNQRVVFFAGATNPSNDVPARVVLGPNERLAIVGGRSDGSRDDTFVALLEAGGARVAGFGTNGVKLVNQGGGTIGDRGVDVAFRPGGGLVALVTVDSTPVTAVLHAFEEDGDPDPSFSGDGDLPLDVGGTETAVGGLIEHGGRLYASGSTRVGADTDAFVAQVEADGSGLKYRHFDMRGRLIGPGQAVISHSTDLTVAAAAPETLVAVGAVQYTTDLGSTAVDWAAAAFNNFGADLTQAAYGDIVMPAPGNFGLSSVAAGPDRWLAVAGRHLDNSDDGFGGARLLLDAEKGCDLGVGVADPAEIVFHGTAAAALGARVTNLGTRPCGGALTVPAPYRMAPVETGPIAAGATFVVNAAPLAYEGARRAEDILAVSLAAADDENTDNNQAAAHVVFSFCDLALEPIGRAGAIPTEGRRRFPVNLRNGGTTSCRVRIGSKRPYSLASGQSASDRVAVAAPRGARPGARVAVVLRAGATDDVDAANNAVTVSPIVVGVGDSDVRRHGRRGFSGIARKGAGTLEPKRLRPARVHVALLRKGAKSCSWLRSSRGTFSKGRAAADGSCSGRRWVRAKGAKRWRVRLARALPPGRYVLFSRVTIGAGFPEARFSAKDRNRVEFRVV